MLSKGTQPKNAFKSVKLSRGARPTLSAVAALTAGSAPDYRADLKKVNSSWRAQELMHGISDGLL